MNKVISEKEVRRILKVFFEKVKAAKNIYLPVINGLFETSLRGVDSHGIRLAPHYIRATLIGRINPKPNFKFKKTAGSVEILDADHTYGITAGVLASEKAMAMAKKNGVGIVVIKNSSHFGAAAIYGLMIARHNMIARVMTPVEDIVVPYGGSKPYLGTNAYCYSTPMQGEDPLILDMATTEISFNKLQMYRKLNKKIKMGWAVDNQGDYTDDPNKAVALTHFGGYKGYGIALEPEIFSSLLSDMPFGPYITHMYPLNKEKRNLSHFIEAIDISKFTSVSVFKKRLKQMADEIRAIKPAKGFAKVMLPGDPEKETYAKRKRDGIPLTEEIINDYNNLIGELKINIKF